MATFYLGKGGGTLLAADDDNQAPIITNFEITKGTFNTESGEDNITFSLTITDDVSGVSHAIVRWIHINLQDEFSQYYPVNVERVSGDNLNGVYTGENIFPQYVTKGQYKLEMIELYDNAGNGDMIYEADVEAIMGAAPGTLRVTNTATVDDSVAPILKSLSITSGGTINTTSADQNVTVVITVEDNLAGIRPVNENGVFARMNPIDEDYIGQEQDIVWEITTDNGLEKIYTGVATIPKGAKGGLWVINSITVRDVLVNTRVIAGATLCSTYSNANCRVNNTATVFDIVPPTIKSFNITPKEFNTSQAEAVITVEIEYEDLFSGVNIDRLSVTVTPLIGTQFRPFWNFELVEGSGDEFSGTYTATATLPQYSKAGIWQVNLGGEDRVGNRIDCPGSRWSPSCDATQLFPNDESAFIVNTTTADSVTVDRNWTFESATTRVTFPEGTVVTKKEGGLFAFFRMVGQSYNTGEYEVVEELIDAVNLDETEALEACVEEEDCIVSEVVDDGLEGKPVGFVRAGIPGLNLQFDKPVTVSMLVDSKFNGWTLDVQSFEEGGEVWANEDTCLVANSRCTFTVSHASFFSANLDTSQRRLIQTVRGADNGVYTRYSNNYGSTWSSWNKNGTTHTNLTLIQDLATGRVIQARRGTDNGVYTRRSSDYGRTWSGWSKSGSTLGEVRMISVGNRVIQAIRGGDSNIYTRYSSNGGTSWSSWVKNGGTPNNVTMVYDEGSSRLFQAVRGNDNGVYTRYSTNSGTSWSKWVRNGSTPSDVTMIVSGGRLIQTVRGMDNGIYTRYSTNGGGSWSNWVKNGSTTGLVSMLSTGSHLVQTVRGLDNGIYTRSSSNNGNSWGKWVRNGSARGDVNILYVDSNSRVYQAVRGGDNGVYTRYSSNNGSTWSAWVKNGSTLSDVTMMVVKPIL